MAHGGWTSLGVVALLGGLALPHAVTTGATPARHIAPLIAPYVDMTLYPLTSLGPLARASGLRTFTAAFIVDGGACHAAWGGVTALGDPAIGADIAGLRQMGGTVIISFGGQAGSELAQTCASVATLVAQYRKVIETYHATWIDFDVEGAAVAAPTSIDRRDRAIAALESAATHAGHPLRVSFTLPVLPTGLDDNGLSVLRDALHAHVRIDRVNIMAMDYGDQAAPHAMGAAAMAAATNTVRQLASLLPHTPTAALWKMLGMTPMIGMNDVTPEVFSLADARAVAAFARQHGVGLLSFWSAARDQTCPHGATYTADNCSGVAQAPNAFAHIFAGIPYTLYPASPPKAAQKAISGYKMPTFPTPSPTPSPTTRPLHTLLTNGGFETGTLAGWQCVGAVQVVSKGHSGHAAIRLPATSTGALASCSQMVRTLPHTVYTLSAWARGQAAFLAAAGSGLSATETWATSSAYTPLSLTITTGAHTNQITIALHGWYGQGAVQFADVALTHG